MIIGAHAIIYSTNADADRAFLRDVLGFPHVDVGGGWLIFGLPPAEVAVHPAEKDSVQEFYLMCDDIDALIADMRARNVACEPVQNQVWGRLTHLTLPGGGRLGVYQPRHARPQVVSLGKAPLSS
jgi:hypothetical protein